MIYVGAFAALVSVVSASVSFKSLRTAQLALNKKYQIFTACDFDLGSYDVVSQAYDTVVTIYNLGEVTVLVEVELGGVIEYFNHAPLKIATTTHRLIIKSGESKSANIKLITGNSKGTAKALVYAKRENAMVKPTSISYPLAAMSI